nr:diglucosylglycerate octanoyltransferase [Nocardia wallacei]
MTPPGPPDSDNHLEQPDPRPSTAPGNSAASSADTPTAGPEGDAAASADAPAAGSAGDAAASADAPAAGSAVDAVAFADAPAAGSAVDAVAFADTPTAGPDGDAAVSAGGGRPVLLVLADSLAYFGPKGGLAADDPRIWPNLVAAELDWDVELVARIGWTCRDAHWALIGDPRVWAAVPRAGAVVFATGGMDSLPSPLPTALRELIRYVRPPALRRRVRTGYQWLQPRLSKLGRPVALPPHVSVGYLEQSRNALAQLRPELPIIGVLPSVHDCDAYGRVHTGREPAVRALRAWSETSGVPLVDLAEAVRDNIFHGDANPDGIHWGWEGHTAVARAMVKALAEARAPEAGA